MATEEPSPPAKPKGHSLGWGEAEIASLSAVGPEDIASARALWRRTAPKRLAGLLDARHANDSRN